MPCRVRSAVLGAALGGGLGGCPRALLAALVEGLALLDNDADGGEIVGLLNAQRGGELELKATIWERGRWKGEERRDAEGRWRERRRGGAGGEKGEEEVNLQAC